MRTTTRTAAGLLLIASVAVLAALALSACAPSSADRRAALDAEWEITYARSDEINAEYSRRMDAATTPQEREAAIQWRAQELEKNSADQRTRKAAALRALDGDE
jgi:hypothetical protein